MRDSLDPETRDQLRRWLLFAIGAAGVAGILAVLIAMARVPALQVISPSRSFSVLLVGHVTFSLIIWLLAFVSIAAIYTGGVFLREHAFLTASAGKAFGLATLGSGLLLSAILAGRGNVILSDYVPVLETPAFFTGYAGFAAGIFLVVGSFLRGIARHRGMALPLPVYGMTTVSACLMITILALLGGIATVGSRTYHALFWGAGHALQYVYVGVLSVTWYILAASAFGASPVSPKVSRFAFALYPMLALPIPFFYFLVDPVYLPRMASVNTFFNVGLGLPTILHVLLIAVSVARALSGRSRGWLREVWRNPQGSALALSVLLFLVGGLLAPLGTPNTLKVTAHYHAMLVGGVTLAFMGLVYHLLPAIGRDINGVVSARVQPYIFALGVLVTVFTLAWAGSLGAPRKTVVAGTAMGFAWSAALNLMALGAGLATLGGAIFVGSVLRTLVRVEPQLARAPETVGRNLSRIGVPTRIRSDSGRGTQIVQRL